MNREPAALPLPLSPAIARLVVIVGPLLVLTLIAWTAIQRHWLLVRPRLAEVVGSLASHQLEREVRVGGLTWTPRRLVLHNLHIAERGGGGDFAVARSVVLHFDLRELWQPASTQAPIVGSAIVREARIRIARNAAGVWNFADLFRPRAPEARPVVGRIWLKAAAVEYDDLRFPAPGVRAGAPLRTTFHRVDGVVDLHPDRSVSWDGLAEGSPKLVRQARIAGSYSAQDSRLFLDIQECRAQLARLLAPFAPKGVSVASIPARGSLTLLYDARQRAAPWDYQAAIQVEGATFTARGLKGPVYSVSGLVNAKPEIVRMSLEGLWRGQRVAVDGAVHQPANPVLDLLVRAENVKVGETLLSAGAPESATQHFRGVRAVASGRARLQGRPSKLSVEGLLAGTVVGEHAKGIAVPREAAVRAAFAWTAGNLRATAVVEAPELRWRDHVAKGLRANIAVARDRVDADARGTYLGALAAVRGSLKLGKDDSGYRVLARIRGLDAALVPELTDYRLQGMADLDLALDSASLRQAPQGRLSAAVSNAWIEGVHVGRIAANLESDGRQIVVQPFQIAGAPGSVVVSGTVDLKEQSLNLTADARQVDLNLLFRDRLDRRIGGTAYARSLHVSGPLREPRIAGQVQVYGLSLDDNSAEFGQISLEGNRRTVRIVDAELWRLPGILTMRGVLWHPFRENGRIHLEGEVSHAELQDLAQLAGSQEPITGQASGAFEVAGSIRHPEVQAPAIVISRGGYRDFPVEHIEASASLAPDRTFRISARARDIDLALLDPLLGDAASLTGTLQVRATLQGSLATGTPENLEGEVEAATEGLTVNGELLGDLRASILLRDRLVVAARRPDGPPPVSLEGAEPKADITSLRYDLDTGDLALKASVEGLPVGAVRSLLSRSPKLLTDPDTLPNWLLPALNSVDANLSGTIEADGSRADPRLALRLSASGARVFGLLNTEIRGDLVVRRSGATLNSFRASNGTALLEAEGRILEDGNLSGRLVAEHLPISLTEAWFPDKPDMLGWQGEVSQLNVELGGTREKPVVTGSAIVEKVFKAGTAGFRPPVLLRRAELARLHLEEGTATAEGVTVEFERLEPGQVPRPAASETTYRASGSATIGFSWTAPFIRLDSQAALSMALPEQSLELIQAIAPGAPIKTDGRIAASLVYTGTLGELSDPQKALSADVPSVHLKGEVRIRADRIRVADARTILQDVNLHLRLDGDRLKVEPNPATGAPFTARTAVLGPTGQVLPGTVFPLSLSGELPVREGVHISQPLTLTAQRLAFAEAPLPLLGSGRVAGVLAGPSTVPGTAQAPGVRLVVERSLLTPRISGTVHIRDTDLRVPETTQPFALTARETVVRPSFNIRFQVGDRVRVSAPAVSAVVKSPPSRPILVQGSLGRLKMGGELLVESGHIAFPTARFAIQPGGTIALLYPQYVGAATDESTFGVFLDLTSRGRLTARSITGATRRYLVTAEIRGTLGAQSPLFLDQPGSAPRVGGGQGLQIAFRSSPPDLALSSAGLQRKITGILGGEEAIAALFRSDSDAVRALGAQALDAVTASLLPDLFERAGLGRALGFEEFLVDYNRLEAFTFRFSRRLVGPLDVSFWHRLGGPGGGTSPESAAWELRTGLRLNRSLRFSWSLDNQSTNGLLLEGVMRF